MTARAPLAPAVDGLVRSLLRRTGLEPTLADRLSVGGVEPVLPSIFRIGTAACASIGAAALGAVELGLARGGPDQTVRIDGRSAAASFRSERLLRLEGAPVEQPAPGRDCHRTRDGRLVQLHRVYPHHRRRIHRLLGCEAHPERDLGAAVARWEGEALESAIARAGACGALWRTVEEWQAHPHGEAVRTLPVLELERTGDASPEPLPELARGSGPEWRDGPAASVRVLDLTRVIAGPVCGRTLAEYGADVMRISPPGLPELPTVLMDGGRGKRSAIVDLRSAAGRSVFERLLEESDVVVQGFRPGALAGLGYDVRTLQARRPGLVCLSLAAWGWRGPWAERRGFDSLVQTASGIAAAQAMAAGRAEPLPLPCQALDHATGYLAAFGILAALVRRAREGGSWHVRVSLAGTGAWLQSLGTVDGLGAPDPGPESLAHRMEERRTPFGRLRAVRPAAELSATPPRWTGGPGPLDADPPRWR